MTIDFKSLKHIPRHVAIIMDGNGRWAKERDLPRIKGHEAGAQSVRAALRAAAQAGLEYLTIYAFSTENWKRPPAEIDGLMKLLISSLNAYEEELHENKIRLRISGQFNRLPLTVRTRLKKTMEATKHYDKHTLIIALSYGSRTEITDAVKQIASKVDKGKMSVKKITEETISSHLYMPDVPDPELLIRTSGEMRLSNFLLWQLSYAELYVTDTFWPDFREQQFFEALTAFNARDRRFGALKNS